MARLPMPIGPETFQKKKKSNENEIELEDLLKAEDNKNEDNNNDEGGENGPVENGENNATNAQEEKDKTEEEEEEEEDLTLEEHAMIVTAILKPVAITMIIVIWLVYALHVAAIPSTYMAIMIYQEQSSDSTVQKLGGSILNAFVFVIMIVIVTCFLVCLYKYRCLKIIYGWLITACAVLLGTFGARLFYVLWETNNWPLDWITFLFAVWNFIVVGMFGIFWRSHPKVTQFYLIGISALLACFFTRLPEWTTWAILVAVAIYDLFAVLCPKGPLRILVDLSRERDEPIPALLYNGSLTMVGMAVDDDEVADGSDNDDADGEIQQLEGMNNDDDDLDSSPTDRLLEEAPEVQVNSPLVEVVPGDQLANDRIHFKESEDLSRSVKLGLGDFVFYSVLMGRAAMYDITTVFTCFIAIITGLFFTLILLAVYRKALPALPISILLGVLFYLLTNSFLVPFVETLGRSGVFI